MTLNPGDKVDVFKHPKTPFRGVVEAVLPTGIVRVRVLRSGRSPYGVGEQVDVSSPALLFPFTGKARPARALRDSLVTDDGSRAAPTSQEDRGG